MYNEEETKLRIECLEHVIAADSFDSKSLNDLIVDAERVWKWATGDVETLKQLSKEKAAIDA